MRYLDFNKILVPVDFSDASFAAVDAALELVKTPSQVTVLHVLPILTEFEIGFDILPDNELERRKLATNELRKRLRSRKYSGIEIRAIVGEAVQQIVNIAEKEGTTLIVMPSHGRTGFSRFMLGSVAERVLRLAHCPVLILKHVTKEGESDEITRALQASAKRGGD